MLTILLKVLALKGAKSVAQVVSAQRGRTITVDCAMNTVGHCVPPAFIFPRKNMRRDFHDDAPCESLGMVHKSGWMTQGCLLNIFSISLSTPNSRDSTPFIVSYICFLCGLVLCMTTFNDCQQTQLFQMRMSTAGRRATRKLKATFVK